jgi:hypothetical protein
VFKKRRHGNEFPADCLYADLKFINNFSDALFKIQRASFGGFFAFREEYKSEGRIMK